jgi:predicted  nucleic acid-binding Zn-ribbon protein
MAELSAHLENLQQKIQQLLKNQQQLLRENVQLQKELQKAKQTIEDKTHQTQNLQQQIDALKLGVSKWNIEEKALLEKRIDVYLKEIDRCLELLNG